MCSMTIRGWTVISGGRMPLPPSSKFSQFHADFGNFGKIMCWRPLEGWRPLPAGILYPPMFIPHSSFFVINLACAA